MSEIDLKIGGRKFKVVCADGEEDSLVAAGSVLDSEAQFIIDQVGQVSESRMLLMAGLMLADRMSGQIETERALQKKIDDSRKETDHLRSEIVKQTEEIDKVSTLTSDERRDLATLQNSAEIDAEQIRQLGEQNDAQRKEIASLKEKIIEAEANLSKALDQANTSGTKIAQTETQLSEAEERIKKAEDEAATAKATLTTLLEEITNRIETLAGQAEERQAQKTISESPISD